MTGQAYALLRERKLGGTPPRVVAVTSGKGGVGKTSLVANLAALLGAAGHRVVAVDTDFGLANLALMFDVAPRFTLEDALESRCQLSDAVIHVCKGVELIAGASGVRRLGALSSEGTQSVLGGVRELSEGRDLVLLDTAAGIGPAVLATLAIADDVLVVLAEDPASFVDAYAIVKLVTEREPQKRVEVIVNRVQSHAQGAELYERFARVASRFLGQRPGLAGVVPHDQRLSGAVACQRLVTIDHTDAASSRAIQQLAARFERTLSQHNLEVAG